jgi:3'-5' exoribonuclease
VSPILGNPSHIAGKSYPASHHTPLASLEPDERLRGHYRIHDMKSRTRNDGAVFWTITLTDNSGSLTCYGWPEQLGDSERTALPRHTVVEVEARVRAFGNRLVADLVSLDPATPSLEDTGHLLPWASCERPELLPRFRGMLGQIKFSALLHFIDRVLANESVMLAFLKVPASLQYHHAAFGGLFEHSIEVMEIVAGYPITIRAEREIALVGALFHDIGKTRTFDKHLRRTPCGNLVCHDALTLEICAPGLSYLDEAWPEAGLLLRHLWTAANGASRYGIAPRTSLVSMIRGADRYSAERGKDAAAFRAAPQRHAYARVGEETRWRMVGGRDFPTDEHRELEVQR